MKLNALIAIALLASIPSAANARKGGVQQWCQHVFAGASWIYLPVPAFASRMFCN